MLPNPARLLEREVPWRQLEDALGSARAGRGRVVSLEGEAGIGKTSLALSFADTHRPDARVHIGACEHLATPEPVGPLRDIERDSQGRFSVSATSLLATYEALLKLLTGGGGPGLLLIEDIHWADDPTLDLFRYLGRRIRSAPILILTTFRNDETQSHARLAALWSDLPQDCRERIELQPLSPAAVFTLAEQSGRASTDVFAATGGNPFHVTEFLATERSAVPHTVRDATLARTARLSSHARRTLDCAAIFPRQIDQETLRVLAEDHTYSGVEECMRGGMLIAKDDTLAFRHELARRAIHDSMSPLRRRELHSKALDLLKTRVRVRAAEAAHHAHEAAAMQDLVTYSLRAADDADALGAHRESVQHLTRALEHGTWFSNAERAALLERQAETGEQCGAFELARTAIEAAVAARKRAGDIVGLGNALRISARLEWQHGEAQIAEQQCKEALEVMQDHQDTWQYAMALSSQSQLDMLADRNDAAITRAREAMARAEALGRTDIYVHALTNLTAALCSLDVETGTPEILAAIEVARERSALDMLPRLYVCLVYMLTCDRRYPGLFEYFEEGISAAVARDNGPLEAYIRGARALALLDLGRLHEAASEAEFVLRGPYPRGTIRFNAQIALARVRTRLGQPEDEILEELRAMPTTRRDIMRLGPLVVVEAEALWLGFPRPGARENLRAALDMALRGQGQSWMIADIAFWLKTLGEPVSLPAAVMKRLRPAPLAYIEGRWLDAARAWGEIGCPYERAISLSMGDESAQREAIEIFDGLEAAPAGARLRRQMRSRGIRGVPRRPIAHTRASPAGLTRRQSQVLALLAQGLTNGEIAEKLFISTKTAEHHVCAIMARLGADTRHEAADAARKRGLLSAVKE
jgi:DNA-binding CsgD family transcriptional regulator/tetratricopeptide (TPR) repeat protein